MTEDAGSSQRKLIEAIVLTGNHGREPELAQIEEPWGTRLVAFRQLEIAAAHMVALWLECAAEGDEVWEFLHSSFLPDATECGDVLASTLGKQLGKSGNADPQEKALVSFVQLIRSQLERLANINGGGTRNGSSVMLLLILAMILRQEAEFRLCLRGEKGEGTFQMYSSNVGEDFLELALGKLGYHPLGIDHGVSLEHLVTDLTSRVERERRRAQEL